jgi:hypothetical protein
VNAEDKVVVALADPATRGELFDELALESIVAAGYDAEALAAEGPYEPVFDQLTLGPPLSTAVSIDGSWSSLSGERTEASLHVTGLGQGGTPAVAALWRGSVVARVVREPATIEQLDVSWTVTPASADGAATVGFSAAQPPVSAPLALPVTAVVLARDAGFSLTALLAETRFVRERLTAAGIERATDSTLPRRAAVVAVWVLPVTVFDDADWPGATAGMDEAQRRLARRTAAAQWLTAEGIAVAVTD